MLRHPAVGSSRGASIRSAAGPEAGLRLHPGFLPDRRLWISVAVVGLGLVGTGAVLGMRDSGAAAAAFGTCIAVLALLQLVSHCARRRRVAACLDGATVVALPVAEARPPAAVGAPWTIRIGARAADGSTTAAGRPWTLGAQLGEPAFIDSHREWIAGFASMRDPAAVVPITEIGLPFDLSRDELDGAIRAAASHVPADRRLEPARTRLATAAAPPPATMRGRISNVGILVAVAIGCGIGLYFAPWTGRDWFAGPFLAVLVVAAVVSLRWFPISMWTDAGGFGVRTIWGTRRCSWADVVRVDVRPTTRHRNTFLAHGEATTAPIGRFDEIEARLDRAGSCSPDVTPRLRLRLGSGATIPVGPNFGWECARHVCRCAASRGIDLAIG